MNEPVGMSISPAAQQLHKMTLEFARKQLAAGCPIDQLAAALLAVANGLIFDMNAALIQALQQAERPNIKIATVDEAEAIKRLRNNGNGKAP